MLSDGTWTLSGTKGRSDVCKQGRELNPAKTFRPVEWIRDAMARSRDNSAGTWEAGEAPRTKKCKEVLPFRVLQVPILRDLKQLQERMQKATAGLWALWAGEDGG